MSDTTLKMVILCTVCSMQRTAMLDPLDTQCRHVLITNQSSSLHMLVMERQGAVTGNSKVDKQKQLTTLATTMVATTEQRLPTEWVQPGIDGIKHT